MTRARRYNEGKPKYQLVPPEALRLMTQVYTEGSAKYTVYEKMGERINGIQYRKLADRTGWRQMDSGDNNWRKGQPWTESMGSVLRHIEAWRSGIDVDPDLNCHHLAHAAWGLLSLLEFHSIHPELDDRQQWFRKRFKRVWVDIDSCCQEFEEYFLKYLGLPEHHPTDWQDHRFRENLVKIKDDREFWINQPPLADPKDFTYPLTGYCTSRLPDDTWTLEALRRNGFPVAEFINVRGGSKAKALKGICDVMLDDSINTFMECQREGICCFLMSRPHNEKYNVQNWRVSSVKEYFERVREME